MNNNEVLKYKKYEYIIPLLHFLASFLWQGRIFVGFGNWDQFKSIAIDDNVLSDRVELLLVYVLSRVFSLLIIIGFWKLVFYVVKKNLSKNDIIILGTILIIGLFFVILCYPTFFGLEIDNYTNFFMARRFQPTYWNSIYTGALYAGCFMVFPHPIALNIFQWIFFWFAVSYIYLGIGKLYGDVIGKYLVLLLFLLPESFYLTFNAYRNNFYTILVLLYISHVYFCIKNDSHGLRIRDVLLFSVFTAFIMVWRSEGILIGAGGFIIYLLFVVKPYHVKNTKVLSLYLIGTCLLFVTLDQIQDVGSKKYYGQDYMIINTTNVLCSVFNNPNANLSYEGAEEDLNSIEAVIPVQVLKEYGMKGYRDYNWTNGRLDFNQTLASSEQADSYMSAYYHIIANNFETYMNVQINSFFSALQIPTNREVYSYEEESELDLDDFVYDEWQSGYIEVRQMWNSYGWENNHIRILIGSIINGLFNVWKDLMINSGINPVMHALSLVIILLFFFKELIYVICKKKQLNESMPYIISFILLLGECVAIMLFMPEGRAAYMYPVLYAGYLMIYMYLMDLNVIKKGCKEAV